MKSDFVRDRCNRGHNFIRMKDHPRPNGIYLCPHCAAAGLSADETPSELALTETMVNQAFKVLEPPRSRYGQIPLPFPNPNPGETMVVQAIRLLIEQLEAARKKQRQDDYSFGYMGDVVQFLSNVVKADKIISTPLHLVIEEELKSLSTVRDLSREAMGEVRYLQTLLNDVKRILETASFYKGE